MAEIYTYSANASQGHLSPDTSDHINSVLADLGLGGTPADASGPSRTAAEPAETTAHDGSAAAGHVAAPPADAAPDHAGAILAGSASDPGFHAAPATVAEPQAEAVAASAPHAASAPAAAPSTAAGADSLPGAHAGYGSDAFALGTDTLWGSDGGGAHGLAALPPAHAGGDTIRSSGGMETIYGGNATIYASGHAATLGTDTVHAGGEGTTMDGSASAQALHTGGASSFADLPGGSGSDTILLHDGAGGFVPAGDDAHAASAYSSYDGHGTGAHDAALLATGAHDSVIGGDGSDHFALLGYDAGPHGSDPGAADDGSAAHHDPYLAGGHVSHSDLGTFVSYHDGYDAGYADPDHLPFTDTVMAG